MHPDPDILEADIPDDWYLVAGLYHTAAGCADQLSDLENELSIIDVDICNACGDAARWLETFQEELRSEAGSIDDADVDAEPAPTSVTLTDLAEGLQSYCATAYREELTKILIIAALAEHAGALLAEHFNASLMGAAA